MPDVLPHHEFAREIADWLRSALRAVVFTGAGISTESGIPDFRSPQGIWATTRPVYFQEYLASASAREESWRQKVLVFNEFGRASPNAGHLILAAWEHSGRIARVVTQNIDGLHTAAGSRAPIEVHGTAKSVKCLDCQARFPVEPQVEEFRSTGRVPACPQCGGLLKWATISFGEPLDPRVWDEALEVAREADVFLAIGSSLVVEPAASLPRVAQEHGARLAIINREATPLDSRADVVYRASISEALEAIDACLL